MKSPSNEAMNPTTPYTIRFHFYGQNRHPDQILRQTPDGKGYWNNIKFLIGDEPGPYDYLVVFGSGHNFLREEINKQNTLFIASEPPAIKTYPPEYLAQFEHAISSDPNSQHPNITFSQQGYPWFCGLSDDSIKLYDEYAAEKHIEKTKLISVVCSNKCTKPGHHKRFEFVNKLKEEFGDSLDLFGSGQNFVPDKADAIRPYQYHIVIENSISPHYWSEKLADSYLEGAFPFYSGCPNIDQYFSPESYQLIDLDDIEATIRKIRQAIEQDQYSKSIEALHQAKLQVINDYNLFNIITEHVRKLGFPSNEPPHSFQAYPGKFHRKGKLYKLKFHIREAFTGRTK